MNIKSYRTLLNEHKQLKLDSDKTYYICDNAEVTDPEILALFLTSELKIANSADEYFYVFCLNAGNQLIGVFEASHGGNCESIVPIREIFQKSMLIGAISIIVAHNHPSGNVKPSIEDLDSTTRIKEAGKILNIELLDHIIVGPNAPYFSFCESGLI